MSDTKDLIDILESIKHAFCVGEEVEMFDEIKAIVEDYPRIKAMLDEFISQEVDELKHMRHEDVQPDLVENKEASDYLEYWASTFQIDCESPGCPVTVSDDPLKSCHKAYDKIRKLLKGQPDKEYGGLIDALQVFVDSPDDGLRVSHIRDHLLMAIQALKWKGGKE